MTSGVRHVDLTSSLIAAQSDLDVASESETSPVPQPKNDSENNEQILCLDSLGTLLLLYQRVECALIGHPNNFETRISHTCCSRVRIKRIPL